VLDEIRGAEDGRTQDLSIGYDSVTADESWDEFLERVNDIGKTWHTEIQIGCEQKSYGRQIIRGVEIPEYSS
jgi:hypothetical protein